ncbi:MAG: M23 family metallopeptidase [Bacteroidales bacterium]|nr:M23 family metallopeptidase [Bacteroidales bacterium]
MNSHKKYNISISDADSGEKLYSTGLSGRKFIVLSATAVVAVIILTYLLVALTPLRTTVKGYPSKASRQMAIENRLLVDSLERQINLWAYQVGNIQRIVTGREPMDIDSIARTSPSSLDSAYAKVYARQDSLLRGIVEKETAMSIEKRESGKVRQIEGLHYFTPLHGIVTEEFNEATGHTFIAISADEGTSVCSILEGTVIASYWSDETGYTIYIQHSHNLVSVYKHNQQLLKKAGDHIKVGTPIATVGSSGSLNTGTSLHLELWHDGTPLDPTLYINF